MSDLISRQAVIEAIEKNACNTQRIFDAIKALPTAEPHIISYQDCTNALLMMWMDNVLTDGEYYRIADKLNKRWGKTELPEPYKGVTE